MQWRGRGGTTGFRGNSVCFACDLALFRAQIDVFSCVSGCRKRECLSGQSVIQRLSSVGAEGGGTDLVASGF